MKKEYCATHDSKSTAMDDSKYFLNGYYNYYNSQYVFTGMKRLKDDINYVTKKIISEGGIVDIHLYERDVTTWKKYNGSVAGVLPNIQFGIFQRFCTNENWKFVDTAKPPRLGIDEYYYPNYLSADSDLKKFISRFPLVPKKEEVIIFYREISDWKEISI